MPALAVAALGAQAIPGVGEAVDAGMMFGWQAAKIAEYAAGAGEKGMDAFLNFFTGCSPPPDDAEKAFGIFNSIPSIGKVPFKAPPGIKPAPKPEPPKPEPPKPEPPKPSPNKPDKPTKTQDQESQATRSDAPKTSSPLSSGRVETSSPPSSEQPKPSSTYSSRQSETSSVSSSGPPTSTSSQSSTTSSGESCPQDSSKPGLVARLNNNCNNPKQHVTTITKSNPQTVTVTTTCDANVNPQPCAFYYYAAGELKKKNVADIFTCSDDFTKSHGRTLQKPYGTMATEIWTKQHTDLAWRSYIASEYTRAGEVVPLSCDRDEWPPAYFLPAKAMDKGWSQLVRYVPWRDNRSAGNIWGSFCKANDGGEKNGQMVKRDHSSVINDKLVKVVNSRTQVDKKGTTTTFMEVDFTRAVFTMAYNWRTVGGVPQIPAAANDWHLRENPCWPSAILPDDPGFALLTDDPWYTTRSVPPNYVDLRASYSKSPDALLTNSAKARGWIPVNPGKRPQSQQGAPSAKAPKTRRDLDISDEGLILSDFNTNTTRRLTEQEIEHEVEVTDCADTTCSKELAELAASGEAEMGAYIIVPGRKPSRLPMRNEAPEATMVSAPTPVYHPSQKSGPMPEAPVMTAV